jgi:hypothetical protein
LRVKLIYVHDDLGRLVHRSARHEKTVQLATRIGTVEERPARGRGSHTEHRHSGADLEVD